MRIVAEMKLFETSTSGSTVRYDGLIPATTDSGFPGMPSEVSKRMSFPPDSPTESFHYRIEAQVGSGSMGIVYRALDLALDRVVAIKTLRHAVLAEETPEVQHEMRQRFLREAKAAARLSHPGITVVHHADTEGDVPYMVMEWLEGRTLEQLLAQRGRLELGEATHLVVSLLDILETAHREGVVHRDIKPANLMILSDGRLKVTDFGIALVAGLDQMRTQAGVVLATPRFASPEQLRGDKVDARSDLFSTGVLLFHLLTGEFPFSGASFIDLANSIMNKPPVLLRDHLPDVPPALDAVVRRSLEKSLKERFTSALEMGESLRQFVTSTINLRSGPSAVPQLDGPNEGQDTTAFLQLYRDLPRQPALALARTVETWGAQELPAQDSLQLLARLLEKPLHAPPFAGAARIGDVLLLVEEGVLLGAVNAATGESGDAVAEQLPANAPAQLYALPQAYPTRFTSLLATLLHPPRRRQSDLDSTFINLSAFATKLEQEKFDGIIRLDRGPDWALLFLSQGERVLSLFSEGWDGVPIEHSWLSWVAKYPVIAHLEEKVSVPLGFWYRHSLKDFELAVKVLNEKDAPPGVATEGSTSSRIRGLFRSPKSDSSTGIRLAVHPRDRSSAAVGYEQAPSYHLLTWALKELPGHFIERGKATAWKYLVEWLALVRKAYLYHHLPHPDSREEDFFDLVTSTAEGKVLHLADRVAQSSPEVLQTFIDRVLRAKRARIKTGDVGGAILVAPEFDDETLTFYNEKIQKKSVSGSLLGLEDAVLGYEGFLRIGPRRGFHLLLVEEKDGIFEPLIPN